MSERYGWADDVFREEDDAVTLVRVYCGLASTNPTEAQQDQETWLIVSVVDDAGRILDVCKITDDASGYAELSSLLTHRAGGFPTVAVATDSDEYSVIQLLTAAGGNLAYADEDSADDYANRFTVDHSVNGAHITVSQRRAIGLARALQAGMLSAVPQSPPRDMITLKPLLSAHAAVISGRQSSASTLREILRELYPAALHAYPDPAEPIPLAILDALPEPGLLGNGPATRARDTQVVAELTATGLSDSATLSKAIAALRTAIAEAPRRTGVARALTTAVSETIRHSVASVRACDKAAAALIDVLADRVTHRDSGHHTSSLAIGSASSAAPIKAHEPAPDALSHSSQPHFEGPRGRVLSAPPMTQDARGTAPVISGHPESDNSTSFKINPPSGSLPVVPSPMPPETPAADNSSLTQPSSEHRFPYRITPPPQIPVEPSLPQRHARSSTYGNNLSVQPTSRQNGYNPLTPENTSSRSSELPTRNPSDPPPPSTSVDHNYSLSFGLRDSDSQAPRLNSDISPPGSRSHWPLIEGNESDIANPRNNSNHQPPVSQPHADSQQAHDLPKQREGRVIPPWQSNDLPAEPPTLRLVESSARPANGTSHGPSINNLNVDPPALRIVDSDHESQRHGRNEEPPSPSAESHDGDGDLLIFAAARSAWFVDEPNQDNDVEWTSAADAGWHAARHVSKPLVGADTNSGLPKRVPQQNLVPGSAVATQERPLRIVRDPATIAAHTSGYFQGWRRGQEVGGYSVGGRPGRESAGGWDFSREHSDHQYEYHSARR